jgi:hypothetical protein
MRTNCTSLRVLTKHGRASNRKLLRSVFLAAVAIGCSSTGNDDNNGQGLNDGGAFDPTKWNQGAGGGGQVPPTCTGNGVVDPGEECDGPANTTCANRTLGARPNGTVTCVACKIVDTGCTSSGPGAGGAGPGTGGGIGAGGMGPAGGTNGGGGTTTTTGAGGSIGGDGTSPTVLPQPKGTCAPFTTGDMTFNGQKFKVWAGAPAHGPLVIYWYATGSSVNEVGSGMGQAAISEITSQGGVVAAMYKTTATGQNTGNNVWYTGDFDYSDEVVACAIQQQHIDTRHIHAAGFSAGGLQTGYMAFARSNYMASVVTYSGGSLTQTLQDPGNVPSVMCQHGTKGQDVVILDFSDASHSLETAMTGKGGFALDCDHGGGHMIPGADVAATWHFMKDHPYKSAKPDAYVGGIPAGFPSYCKIP